MPFTETSSDARALSLSFSISNSCANNRAQLRCTDRNSNLKPFVLRSAPSPCSQHTDVSLHLSSASEDVVGRLLPEVSHAGGVERGAINAMVSHEQFSSHRHTHENTQEIPPRSIGHSDEQGGTPSSASQMSRVEARTQVALDASVKTCSHTQRCGGQASSSVKTCSHTQRCGGQASSQCPAVRMTRADARGACANLFMPKPSVNIQDGVLGILLSGQSLMTNTQEVKVKRTVG